MKIKLIIDGYDTSEILIAQQRLRNLLPKATSADIQIGDDEITADLTVALLFYLKADKVDVRLHSRGRLITSEFITRETATDHLLSEEENI